MAMVMAMVVVVVVVMVVVVMVVAIEAATTIVTKVAVAVLADLEVRAVYSTCLAGWWRMSGYCRVCGRCT
jgi:hypothetical protein